MRLSTRVLNRTTLTRQLLLARQDVSITSAAAHLVGLQAQNTTPPYLALWSRLSGFSADALSSLILDRSLVRMTLMRGTLHLVPAADCAVLRPPLQPMLTKALLGTYGPALDRVNLSALSATARTALTDGPLSLTELGTRLTEQWPDIAPRTLAFAAQLLTPLVQVPPRGIWGQGGPPTNALASAWIGADIPETGPVGPVIERYLRAFGPASAADVAAWSRMTGLRPHINALDLVRYEDPNGRELLDVPDGELADADVAAPVRYLPVYDNVLLSHADRTRIMSEEIRKRWGAVKNGVFPSTFLVDGFVRGTWTVEETRTSATLVLRPYEKVSTQDQEALSDEGAALLTLMAPDKKHDFRMLLT